MSVTLGTAIPRSLRMSRQLVLPHPLSRQAAASKIRRTITMKPLSPPALRQRLPLKTLVNFSPMAGKRYGNGIDDGERALTLRIELPTRFLVLDLSRSQQILLVKK